MKDGEARGWFSNVRPNGRVARPAQQVNNDNVAGLAAPEPDIVIETTPEHRNLIAGDRECVGWTRHPDDPGVVARRTHLQENNGISDLEMVTPDQVDRAAELFYRDGFVVVVDALTGERFDALKEATNRVVGEILQVDPDGSVGGGAGGLPHRYSFGRASASRHQLHDPAWVDAIDLGTTTPILAAISGSDAYIVGGGGGDVALPGAIEYQGLHADRIWTEPHDPIGGLTTPQMPVPVVTINFPMVDLTAENGPIRQIPGSQRWLDPIPSLADEPDAMKLSTLVGVPAGAAVFRDNRCWHGGTPNLSDHVRAFPNVEYYAPWFRSEGIHRCMPYEQWQRLSDHGKRICRYVACGPGEHVLGAGFVHPREAERDRFLGQQLDELQAVGSHQAQDWWLRR